MKVYMSPCDDPLVRPISLQRLKRPPTDWPICLVTSQTYRHSKSFKHLPSQPAKVFVKCSMTWLASNDYSIDAPGNTSVSLAPPIKRDLTTLLPMIRQIVAKRKATLSYRRQDKLDGKGHQISSELSLYLTIFILYATYCFSYNHLLT